MFENRESLKIREILLDRRGMKLTGPIPLSGEKSDQGGRIRQVLAPGAHAADTRPPHLGWDRR